VFRYAGRRASIFCVTTRWRKTALKVVWSLERETKTRSAETKVERNPTRHSLRPHPRPLWPRSLITNTCYVPLYLYIQAGHHHPPPSTLGHRHSPSIRVSPKLRHRTTIHRVHETPSPYTRTRLRIGRPTAYHLNLDLIPDADADPEPRRQAVPSHLLQRSSSFSIHQQPSLRARLIALASSHQLPEPP
jgi:hypothetical protein